VAAPAAPANAPAPAVAKPAAEQKPTQATPEALRRIAADALERLALLNLRVTTTAAKPDFAASAMILGLAQNFAPDDFNIARRRAEAAWGAGDSELLMAMTRRIVQIDPTCTVAQLRLISERLSQYQTTEERLAKMESFLGPAGASLDPTIRSRIALDAALLCRERGDDAKFVERLKQATQLDSTNKDAALLALNYYTSRSSDPMGRLEMITNLLYADPIDPNVHQSLTRQLASMGAYTQAMRFKKVATTIDDTVRHVKRFTLSDESILLNWWCEGASAALKYITNDLLDRRGAVAKQAREMRNEEGSAGLRGTNSAIPSPENLRLDAPREEIRLAAAMIVNNQAELKLSLIDFAATVDDVVQRLSNANSRGNLTQQAAEDQIRAVTQELNFWRLITNVEVDRVAADMPAATKDLSVSEPRLIALNAWNALRGGDAAKAKELCGAPSPDEEPYLTLCRAEAMATLGDREGATLQFARIASDEPLNVLAPYALDRSAQISGGTRKPGNADTALARQAADYARQIPTWIDTMITEPTRFQTLTLDPLPALAGPMDRVPLTLHLKNVSPIPLAMGSDKPMNTRFVANSLLEVTSQSKAISGEPEVFEFDRRFRLEPKQELTVTVWAEAGMMGYISENALAGPVRIRYTVLQGFEVGSRGAGCLEVTSPAMARGALLEARLSLPQLGERLANATDATLPALLIGIRANLLAETTEASVASERDDLVKALVDKYPTWSPTARAFCAAMMPPKGQAAVVKALDDAILADQDPIVRTVALLTRVTDAYDPLLKSAASDADATIVKAAALQQERLGSNGATYTKVGVTELLTKARGVAAPAGSTSSPTKLLGR
jgi:hypothetical protein